MTTSRARKSRALVRRRPNPTDSRPPRVPRMKFNFDGTNLHVSKFIQVSITASNVATDYQQVGTGSAESPIRDMNNMVRQYREYRYNKVTVQWIPAVGPASGDAGSRVYFAYSNNPEQGYKFQSGTAPFNVVADRVNFVKGCRNVFAFNAWERVTWNVPIDKRKPWFDVNTSEAAYDVNVFDRAVQGMIFQAYESTSGAIILGAVRVTCDIELKGLNPDTLAIV